MPFICISIEVGKEHGARVGAARQIGLLQLAEAANGVDIITLEEVDPIDKIAEGSGRLGGTAALGATGAYGARALTTKPATFADMMTPTEAARYRKYWHNDSLNQVSPGVRELSRTQVAENGRYTYLSTKYYDEFGRRRAVTHYSTHPSTGVLHPNPHYHLYDRIKGKMPLMPGEYLGE